MTPGATSERVFDALKEHILSGEVAPGEKLEPAAFADRFHSSVTPVRDALHRLAGAGLVEMRASEGFYLPIVSEPALRDLYVWNAELMRLVTRAWQPQRVTVKADGLSVDIGRATADFFALFALRSANNEYRRQVDLANTALTAARVAERFVLDGLEDELRDLAVSFDHQPTADLLKLVIAYHRRRLQATPDIVRAMYRGDRPHVPQ